MSAARRYSNIVDGLAGLRRGSLGNGSAEESLRHAIPCSQLTGGCVHVRARALPWRRWENWERPRQPFAQSVWELIFKW